MRHLIPRSRRKAVYVGAFILAAATAASTASALGAFPNVGGNPVPAVKQAILNRTLRPPAHPGPQAPKGVGRHQPAASAPPPPEHADVIGTPDQLGGVPLPFPPGLFRDTNMWLDLHTGIYMSVYAGTLGNDPHQGRSSSTAVTRKQAKNFRAPASSKHQPRLALPASPP